MCPKSVITSCDSQTSGEVVGNSPDGSLELERILEGEDTASQRNADNESDVQPVDMLIPIRLGDGCLCDVDFLRVIFRIPVWLRWLGHGRGLGG